MLSKRVITSSVFKVADLVSSFFTQEPVATDFSKFMNALMKGDYDAYKAGDFNEIFPIFQVDQEIRQSPLTALRILALLDSLYEAGNSIEERHMSVQSIFDYFDAVGCSESSVDKALLSLLEAGLIEPYDTSVRDLTPGQRVAISFSGRAHLRLALNNNIFIDQMALTTAIANEDVACKIRDVYCSTMEFGKKMKLIRGMFISYLFDEDQIYMSSPHELQQYQCQLNVRDRMYGFVEASAHSDDDVGSAMSSDYPEGPVCEGAIATVDWFDAEKGFGFVDIEGIRGRVFLHAQQLRDSGIDLVSDGDDLLCDVGRSAKGLHITKVHDIETDLEEVETSECKLIRVFEDRGYGFVQVGESSRDAFFHFSVVSSADREKLKIGSKIKAEIKTDKEGQGLQIKKVISFEDSEDMDSVYI